MTQLRQLHCCTVLTRSTAENIVRTVETLAAQRRVLMCPVCGRRLVQIEQMVLLACC